MTLRSYLYGFAGDGPGCWCHACNKERHRAVMVLCPTCANKRCPKASDHRLECTGSNAAGQKGSVYE